MKTEANTRPDNRDIKQARSKKKQAMALFKRRLANLSKTDLTDSEYEKRSEALLEQAIMTCVREDSLDDLQTINT